MGTPEPTPRTAAGRCAAQRLPPPPRRRPPAAGGLPWQGRVWLNPPYGPGGVLFIERMIEHNHGLLLIPARTETRIFQRAATAADRVVFLRDRLHFVRPNGVASRSSFASVLMAFGADPIIRRALSMADLGWMP